MQIGLTSSKIDPIENGGRLREKNGPTYLLSTSEGSFVTRNLSLHEMSKWESCEINKFEGENDFNRFALTSKDRSQM